MLRRGSWLGSPAGSGGWYQKVVAALERNPSPPNPISRGERGLRHCICKLFTPLPSGEGLGVRGSGREQRHALLRGYVRCA